MRTFASSTTAGAGKGTAHLRPPAASDGDIEALEQMPPSRPQPQPGELAKTGDRDLLAGERQRGQIQDLPPSLQGDDRRLRERVVLGVVVAGELVRREVTVRVH